MTTLTDTIKGLREHIRSENPWEITLPCDLISKLLDAAERSEALSEKAERYEKALKKYAEAKVTCEYVGIDGRTVSVYEDCQEWAVQALASEEQKCGPCLGSGFGKFADANNQVICQHCNGTGKVGA